MYLYSAREASTHKGRKLKQRRSANALEGGVLSGWLHGTEKYFYLQN